MTSYRTCRRCMYEKGDCDRRATVKASIKGLGLTSVAFRCNMRRPLFRPGQRVSVSWPVYPDDWAYEDGYSLESWPATAIQETDKGYVILVDDVPSDHETPARDYIKNDNLFCNVRVSKLQPLDEPDRPICKVCGNPPGVGGKVIGCFADNEGTHGYWGEKCVNVALAAAAREGGDVQQAPAESPQSGGATSAATPNPSPVSRR